MTRRELLKCTRIVSDEMLDMWSPDVEKWSYDLGGGCAIGATALFRHLVNDRGLRTFLVQGMYKNTTHAFVLVDVDGVIFIADPTFIQFEEKRKVRVEPFPSPVRQDSRHGGYRIWHYTSLPSHVCRLFHGWGKNGPSSSSRECRSIMSSLRNRAG